ncbi:50S ribosomal protein L29 [Candidatus Giovannonibacteria bacterium RIFCSPLOWO2_02_FULL_43_11b]|uniref:Large ribosomal subunit protein uL29 n=1 Tax=Candidatus Giovannonibacteria bacterium RIFCSPHIGHO2_12_FULL_43_15 TaxID=1798341 RepID=A0A1F5WR57_9BACT|nr:MAG: 50S ribosomal protein L29 [Candidatus Giovannonibacteria bacterium RIFCSPHIGHO2_01_FULL_43_100]OGF66965.1 MAG: 50S ribosomal protein L29 [Candidatus Giovannonibacteria bacterium RIFCSPHIGHO2_02_FULL_43_32]OGF78146.1 MAG: 50S ribosomal protein L29 [Candidatus Giovannonibacteria bacterium RIFCSPHIGHO2_12_FULL_43_15]OGF78553.1 MAG: 50S ribosomal protein L29 [Candidatus Giovannonibacteria bacterium RIFCSPLOWO2_01_FULL_43_60]OGF89866.1 MAG: 50S ribosomal protein L29 [Candidatus Giovannonibac
METKELKKKSIEELNEILNGKRGELGKFRFDMGFGKNKNIKLGSSLRKDIARILTAINQIKNERN